MHRLETLSTACVDEMSCIAAWSVAVISCNVPDWHEDRPAVLESTASWIVRVEVVPALIAHVWAKYS